MPARTTSGSTNLTGASPPELVLHSTSGEPGSLARSTSADLSRSSTVAPSIGFLVRPSMTCMVSVIVFFPSPTPTFVSIKAHCVPLGQEHRAGRRSPRLGSWVVLLVRMIVHFPVRLHFSTSDRCRRNWNNDARLQMPLQLF